MPKSVLSTQYRRTEEFDGAIRSSARSLGRSFASLGERQKVGSQAALSTMTVIRERVRQIRANEPGAG